jgi:hypothetical protein
MSCRETHGNSAVTSLAKFLTGADEQTVSRVFHQVRRDAVTAFADHATDPAPQDAVAALLTNALIVAETDPRIRDSRRTSLTARLHAALADNANGAGPNQATFHSWTTLQNAILNAPAELREPAAPEVDPTIGTTAEGLTISLGDVMAARRAADESFSKASAYVGAVTHREATYGRRQLNGAMSYEAVRLRERADKLEAAYDATDAGFALLNQSPESDPNHHGHGAWNRRVRQAREARGTRNPIVAAHAAAAALGEPAARSAREQALTAAKASESAWKADRTARNSIALERDAKVFHKAQRLWLYSVAADPDVAAASKSDLLSPASWSAVRSGSNVVRTDRWRALEVLSADMDKAEARIGRISDTEVARRSVARAEARQQVLDSEGHGDIDPVNRRFAEAVRIRRGQHAKTA